MKRPSTYQVNFSPVTFAAVVNRHPLCGLQTHLSLGHLKVVFKWVNAPNVEPQIALKHGDTTYSCATLKTENIQYLHHPLSHALQEISAAALLFCCLYSRNHQGRSSTAVVYNWKLVCFYYLPCLVTLNNTKVNQTSKEGVSSKDSPRNLPPLMCWLPEQELLWHIAY